MNTPSFITFHISRIIRKHAVVYVAYFPLTIIHLPYARRPGIILAVHLSNVYAYHSQMSCSITSFRLLLADQVCEFATITNCEVRVQYDTNNAINEGNTDNQANHK